MKPPNDADDARLESATGQRLPLFVGIFLLALLLRALHLWALRDADIVLLRMGDARSYHLWAERLAAGDWLGDTVFYQAPLYPYFLGAIYTLAGNHPMVVRAAQSVLGAAACGFISLATLRLFSSYRAALVAGVLAALYAPSLFYDGLIQKTSLAFFLTSLLLWLLVEAMLRAGHEGENRLWGGVGLVLGLLILTRENAVLLLLPLAGWHLLEGKWPGRVRLRRASVVFLGLALVLAPVAIRNQVVGGEPHLTTSQFGPNFYMGNNPAATGLPRPLRLGRDNPRFERRDAVLMAERAAGRRLSPGEVSAYWTRRALDYIQERPLDWLRLTGRKLLILLNRHEVPDTEDLYSYADRSPLLQGLSWLFHFGTVAPLALLGILTTRRGRGEPWLVGSLPAIYLASVLLFFVMGRYRHPALPFLLLFAGGALRDLPGFLRRATPGRRSLALGAAALLALLCHLPLLPVDRFRATTEANVGAALEERGRRAEALERYHRALELDPDHVTARYLLATALQRESRTEEALRHFEEAVRLAPERARLRNNYGVALVAAGRAREAQEQFRAAVRLDPLRVDALENLAVLEERRGRFGQALELYRRALELQDDRHATRLRLANLLLVTGRTDEAFAHYGRAAAEGRLDDTLDRLALTVWRMATHPDTALRRPGEALGLARRAVELGDEPPARLLRALAAAQAATGRCEEARATVRRALDRADGADADVADDRLPADVATLREDLERYSRAICSTSRARYSP